MGIKDSVRIVDLTRFGFPEFPLSRLCRDTQLPYWTKCVGLGLALYAIGALYAILSNSFTYFFDYPFASVSLVFGISLALLARATRFVDDALVHCNKRMQRSSKDKRFTEFVSWAQAWAPMNASTFGRPAFWYYLETLGGVLLGGIMGFFWSHYSSGIWWGTQGFMMTFYVAYCALVGYFIGATVFMTMGVVKILRAYGKRFISADRILALDPDRVGGLKPFAQLLLDHDIALSVPSTAVFVYLGMYRDLVQSPYTWLMLVLYAGLLVVVFLVPTMPAHDSMITAKEIALERVNAAFIQVDSAIAVESPKYKHNTVEALGDVYFMHEKASRMAVWPLDISITLKLSLTFIYPIVGSVFVADITHLVGL